MSCCPPRPLSVRFERVATTAGLAAIEAAVAAIAEELAAFELMKPAAYFGTGEDGDLTASSGTTTLTKPTYYNEVTLTGTARIAYAGWPLYIKKFNAENAPARAIYGSGNDGAAGTTQGLAKTPVSGSYLGGSSAGGSGGGSVGSNTNGTAGSSGQPVTSGAGGVGGVGGAGGTSNTSKTGGAGGAAGTPILQAYPAAFEPIRPLLSSGTFEVISGGCGGGGGGSGAGGTVNSGGEGRGGGSGGPVLEVWIGELVTGPSTPAALIDSYGGSGNTPAGTPPGGGGSGGAGGGGGGHARVFIGKRTGAAVTNLICANGGDGGDGGAAAGGGTAGNGGSAGGGGRVLAMVLATGQCLFKPREASGAAAIGSTGGVHTVWGVTV